MILKLATHQLGRPTVLRHDRIEAPWFIERPIDGESSRTY
jgi:hypothetical protein